LREGLDGQERFCAAAWPRLVGAMAHYCGDVYVAEELVQEALLRACRRWSHVSTLASPEGWTYRVAVNLANSGWRRRQAERRARERHGPPDDVVDPVAVEDQQWVRSALQSLSDEQREAVILRYVLDLSVEQTAAVLGTSPGAVRARTHRAMERLRPLLHPDLHREEIHDGQ
jgi:RNA polymerase sigma-70 factor (sigma-E family)